MKVISLITFIIKAAQFDFRRNLSCETALNSKVSKRKKGLESNQFVIAVFLDLHIAFDTIYHTILLKKLKFYNFSNNSLFLVTYFIIDLP